MLRSALLESKRGPDNLLTALESREIILWLQGPLPRIDLDILARFLGLPWKAIVSETSDEVLIKRASSNSLSDPMVHKRGYLQIVDSDPSLTTLPERSLPVYLLNGIGSGETKNSFESKLRVMTMLAAIRRSAPKQLVVLTTGKVLSPGLDELWGSGFRSYITFVSENDDLRESLTSWVEATSDTLATLIQCPQDDFVRDFVKRYEELYPTERQVIRFRDHRGEFKRIDITALDDPQKPILENYEPIEERWLSPLVPTELAKNEFEEFFSSATASWRAYAAGVPWIRDPNVQNGLRELLQKLDWEGADANCVAYIVSESGAGGTTLARALAWQTAREGYPVLLARQLPFVPDPLPMANFLTRVHAESTRSNESESDPLESSKPRPYETPWLLVFDTLHSQYREGDLLKFRKELSKAGRPVCILVVVNSSIPLGFLNGTGASLTWTIYARCASSLGS